MINRGSVVAALTWGGVGWWAIRVGGSAAFVGRDRELSHLRSEVGGDTRLLLVMGDAGVGKTRLVTEAMQRMAGVSPSGVGVCRCGRRCRFSR